MKKENSIVWNGIPSDEVTLKKIKQAIDNTYGSFITIESAKEEIKEQFKSIHQQTGIPKRIFNFLAKSNFKGNADETIQTNSELEEIYEALNKVN